MIDQMLQEKIRQNVINNNCSDGYKIVKNANDQSNLKECQIFSSNGNIGNVQNFNQIMNTNGKVFNNYYNSNNGKYIIRENMGKSKVKRKNTIINGK